VQHVTHIDIPNTTLKSVLILESLQFVYISILAKAPGAANNTDSTNVGNLTCNNSLAKAASLAVERATQGDSKLLLRQRDVLMMNSRRGYPASELWTFHSLISTKQVSAPESGRSIRDNDEYFVLPIAAMSLK
jgi:hypothetical protein